MIKISRIHRTKDYFTPQIYLRWIRIILISLFVISCGKEKKTDEVLTTKFGWEPGISAPKYYPVGSCFVDFGNAGHSSRMSFDNGWGDKFGSVISGEKYKDIPSKVDITYNTAVENYTYKGSIQLDREKLLQMFRKYSKQKYDTAYLVVGMAPGGWIRVWFQTLDQKIDDYVSVEVAKTQLKGSYDDTSDEHYKVKNLENWGEYYTYWQHHGIPYEAWANNEKEYDIIFDFDKPDYHKIGFSYISADGTFYQRGGERVHQKLPVQFEPIAWLGKSNTVYECNVAMPKNFKKYIEQKKLKEVRLKIEIENDDEHAVIYLITNDSKEKLMRFKNKMPTPEEKKNNEYSNAAEVEYFIP
jgi:hypothetical protein